MRRSPVVFDAVPGWGSGCRDRVTESCRDGWTVVLRYEGEGVLGENSHQGPRLVDLSHRRRWDFQDADIGARTAHGRWLPVPPASGHAGQFGHQQVGTAAHDSSHGPLVINRMNRTRPPRQVAIWHLGGGPPPAHPHQRETGSHGDHRRPLYAGLRGDRRSGSAGTPHTAGPHFDPIERYPPLFTHLLTLPRSHKYPSRKQIVAGKQLTAFGGDLAGFRSNKLARKTVKTTLKNGPPRPLQQVVTVATEAADVLVVMTLARGYGELLAGKSCRRAALESGTIEGLRPGGEPGRRSGGPLRSRATTG